MDEQFLIVGAVALAIMITASVFSRRTGVATPLLLVALGIGASYLPATPTVHVEPELVLAGVLPLLLYSSAVQLPVIDVRRNLSMISWLSIVMVIVSALAIGAVVHAIFPNISFALATALGAVVSPTDAVAATAIGHRVGLPPRLMSILEGESLVNDASALVLLRTAIAGLTVAGFSFGHTLLDFLWAVAGAGIIGFVVGLLTVRLRQSLDDPVLNTTISFAVPFVAYFPAEEMNTSGVLAVVVAGLATGAMGTRRFSARDRQTQATTWATISFILESSVFLAMGYQLPDLIDAARSETTIGEITGMVLIVVALLVAIRFLGLAWPAFAARMSPEGRTEKTRARLGEFEEHIAAFEPSDEREENRLAWARRRLARGRADIDFEEREPITGRGSLVLAWAGMRGVVTVAAAQTIPNGTAHRDTIVLAAYFVALVTLVLFGLTLPQLISRLDLRSVSEEEKRDAVQSLLRRIGESAIDTLGPLEEQTVDGEPLDPALVARMKERVLPRLVVGARDKTPEPVRRDHMDLLQHRYLDAMRDALVAERSIGAYRSATYRAVESILDGLEQRQRLS